MVSYFVECSCLGLFKASSWFDFDSLAVTSRKWRVLFTASHPFLLVPSLEGFHGNSAGKESACKVGDPGSIPGLGRSAGEGIGYPLEFSWASLVAQLVKNLPAMWETWIRSLGWEDPLEKGTATHSSILAWKIPWTEQSMWLQRVGHNWVTLTFITDDMKSLH